MKILGMTVALLVAVNAFGADRVQAGLWETTLTGAAPKPMVTKYCITAADAAWMNGDLATLRKHLQESTAEKSRGRCSVKNVELKANRSIVTTACGKVEMVSTTTYFGNRYEATNSNGTTLSGKRVGACPSK